MWDFSALAVCCAANQQFVYSDNQSQLSLLRKSMLKSMLVVKDFETLLWLAGSGAANQSEASRSQPIRSLQKPTNQKPKALIDKDFQNWLLIPIIFNMGFDWLFIIIVMKLHF